MGTILPKLGRSDRHGIGDALFTSTQQQLLGLLFAHPERSFYTTEIISRLAGGTGAVHRELSRLAACGVLTVSNVGSQKHYQANASSPIFEELRGIVTKTFGVADLLRQALQPLGDSISAAFVFGSVAKRTDTASSDIDLFVVSETLTYADLYPVLDEAGRRLGRPVNPTIYTAATLSERTRNNNAFVRAVWTAPRIWLIGDERAFAA